MAETYTTNYNWTKPEVGASIDNWGAFLNGDLDGIDNIVHGIDIRSAGITISDTAPSSPRAGQLWYDSVGGQTYIWFVDIDSSQWVIAVNATGLQSPASTTVLGSVKVDGTTIKAAPDGTISTTVVPLGDNRIINGDMRIDQRNFGAAAFPANLGYTIDRWIYGSSQPAGKFGIVQGAPDTGTYLRGFSNFLRCVSQSAYTPLSTDYFIISQIIEADMISDFAWGTTNAQPVTLSFWGHSTLGGLFSGSIGNDTGARSYPFSFSLPIGLWTKIAITIPGDTAGTWVLSGKNAGVVVRFDLGCGATNRGPANAWASANYVGVTGTVNTVATNGGALNLATVKLEIGSVATPYNRQSLAKSLADCQRYYTSVNAIWLSIYSGAAANFGQYITFPVTMRAAPTVALINSSYLNASGIGISSGPVSTGLGVYATSTTAVGAVSFSTDLTASAEL
jgi:hypothetical protein